MQLCNEKSIEIYLEGDAVVKADPSLIERAVDNFIINGIDNTPEACKPGIRIMAEIYSGLNGHSVLIFVKVLNYVFHFIYVESLCCNYVIIYPIIIYTERIGNRMHSLFN